jgi:mannose-6-phosphate isomerase-like protein (cupin superfamily)
MSLLSKKNCIGHYLWGNGCEGWILNDTEGLSVKQEHMPAGTAETWHFHKHAQQFFFILDGTALFEVEDKTFIVHSQEGFHIPAGKKHRIVNGTDTGLEFILSSQPSTNNDRFNCTDT